MLLGESTLTVRRRASSYVDGEATVTTTSTLTVRGSEQPLTSRERQMLPEGIRVSARSKLFVRQTEPALELSGEGDTTLSDQIQVAGQWYDVHAIESWTVGIVSPLKHRMYVLVAPEDGSGT